MDVVRNSTFIAKRLQTAFPGRVNAFKRSLKNRSYIASAAVEGCC